MLTTLKQENFLLLALIAALTALRGIGQPHADGDGFPHADCQRDQPQ
ncbi:hypothetical protein [Pseudomonas sp. R37(2017)]|nr:hypothetical protein [Pseudomonas sp. R37(2017)]